jgi:hypothetical protein
MGNVHNNVNRFSELKGKSEILRITDIDNTIIKNNSK